MQNQSNRNSMIEELSLDQIDAVNGAGDGLLVTLYNDAKHFIQGAIDGLLGREPTGPDHKPSDSQPKSDS